MAKRLQTNKINEAVYRVRLKHSFKKSSERELLITLQVLQQELERRHRK